jgi:hypothetical protein
MSRERTIDLLAWSAAIMIFSMFVILVGGIHL